MRKRRTSRRDFVKSSAVGLVAAVVANPPETGTTQTQGVVRSGRSNRTLLKGRTVLTLDATSATSKTRTC